MFSWKTGICSIFASVMVATTVQAADITMRLHTLVKSPHPYNDMAAFMAEEINQRSNGEITIKIFDAAQLGKDDTVIGEMGLGTIDLMISSTNNAAKKVPEFQIFSMPYLFSGFEDLMSKVGSGSEAEAYYKGKFADYNMNMQLLALGGSGTRNLANSVRPVNALEDISGFKMRTPPSPMISKTWAELGTLPNTVAWSELYAAVQTGVVNALESSIPGYSGAKLYEVAPFLSLTAHTIQVNHISMSDRAWGKLSDEQKEMFVAVAQEATLLGIERAKRYEVDLVTELETEHGVTVTRPDTSEFQAALADLKDSLVEELGLQEPMAALN